MRSLIVFRDPDEVLSFDHLGMGSRALLAVWFWAQACVFDNVDPDLRAWGRMASARTSEHG